MAQSGHPWGSSLNWGGGLSGAEGSTPAFSSALDWEGEALVCILMGQNLFPKPSLAQDGGVARGTGLGCALSGARPA